jgi:hypothetical protein
VELIARSNAVVTARMHMCDIELYETLMFGGRGAMWAVKDCANASQRHCRLSAVKPVHSSASGETSQPRAHHGRTMNGVQTDKGTQQVTLR